MPRPARHHRSPALPPTSRTERPTGDARPGPPTSLDSPRPKWRDGVLWLAIFAVGCGLRIPWLNHAGVDHFDEGVYASQVPPGAGAGSYPLCHLYAPPFVPILQQLARQTTADQPWSPVWPGIVAGCLTVLAVGWLGRLWFGPVAGWVAASLAATSDVHATFSRTALTDPWLLLWLLLALAFLTRAWQRPSLYDVLAAGLFTALAWWTKYNGWLPLAIGGAALALATVLLGVSARRRSSVSAVDPSAAEGRSADARRGTRSGENVSAEAPSAVTEPGGRALLGRWVSAWIGMAAVAAIFFLAQIYLLHADGHSYAEVAANHRRYVVGLAGWWPALVQQFHNLRWLEGPFTSLLGPALVGLVIAVHPSCRPRVRLVVPLLLWLATALALMSSAATLTLLTAVVLLRWLVSWRRGAANQGERSRWEPNRLGPGCLLAAWFVGLLVATPNYHPYARLTLPFLAATWLGAGWCLASWLKNSAEKSDGNHDDDPWHSWIALAACVVALASPRIWETGVPAWEDRTGLRRAAYELLDAAEASLSADERAQSPAAVLLTYGEPAVYLALSNDPRLLSGEQFVLAPVGEVPRRPAERPLFLLTGPHAARDDSFQRAVSSTVSPRLELVARATFHPSAVLRLDQEDPRHMAGDRAAVRYELTCYRLRY
ncbi:MAG: glycosyltransferase family 39 protein [Pirellulales bacterium]